MRALCGAVAAVVLVLLGSCAGLPGTGPVTQVDENAAPLDTVVRYAPAPPAPGATPAEVVRGFLDAQLAYPLSSATAVTYLSPDAARDWEPAAGVRIYTEPRVVLRSGGGDGVAEDDTAVVEMRSGAIASLDPAGHYSRGGGEQVDRFELRRVDGEWRIVDPPPGTLVTEAFFQTYYRAADVSYFDARGTQLLADPVHLPVGEQLPTALMASLTAGPPESLGSDARTYVPDRKTWRPSVTVDETGTAEVVFDVDLAEVADGVRSRWSAQVVRTLAEVRGITGVRIVAGGEPLVVDESATQTTTAWRRFLPADPVGRPTAVVDGRVATLLAERAAPVAGGLSQAAGDVLIAAATADAVAVARPGGVGISVDGGPDRSFEASGVVSLSWDPDGVLWVADAPDGRLRLRQVAGGEIAEVATPDLTGVESFALDAGARRWAATTGVGSQARLLVGEVERDQRSRVVALRPPRPVGVDVPGPGSVVWSSPTTLAVLGDGASGRQVFAVPIDGAPASGGDTGGAARLPAVDARRLALDAGTDPAQYVTDGRGRLWYLRTGGAWQQLAPTVVTGLTSGR